MRDDRLRLEDILEAIERTAQYATEGRERFERDELVQTWILHHLQILSEACYSMSADFRAAHPNIPWPQIIGMRNILVHQYFGVDLDVVWEAVERDLPALRHEIEVALDEPTT